MNSQVLLLFAINLFSAMGYSLIAPLFPTLGEKRHIGENLIGWIISTYALFNFIITPFCPVLANKYGRKRIFYLSTLLEAICTVLYGFLVYINNYSWLIFLSVMGRVFHGLGSGITGTLVYSLTATISAPEDVKSSLGYMEVAWSLGVATGPLVGSFLYYFGGFSLPFYVLGASLFISVYLIHYLSIDIQNSEDEPPSFFSFLCNTEILLNYIPVIIYLLSNTYYFPSLTNHLTQKWGLSVEMSSIFFVINMMVYFVALQFLDKMTVRFGLSMTIWIGLVMIVIGPLFVYPVAFLPQSIVSIVIGLSFLGWCGAMICVPCLMEFERIIKKRDDKLDNSTINDISSSIFNFAVNIGDFCGPVFGGMISESYGFKWSNISLSLFTLGYSFIFGSFYFKSMYKEFLDGNNVGDKTTEGGSLPEDEDDYAKIRGDKPKGFRTDFVGHRKHTSHSSLHRIGSGNSNNTSLIDSHPMEMQTKR